MTEEQRLVRVAELYYLHGFTQAEIADEIDTSRSMVSLLLKEAKEKGIVEIEYHIKNPTQNHDGYSKRIKEIFAIPRCIVVPSTTMIEREATRLISARGAEYFNQVIRSGDNVGIAWGLTCTEFVRCFQPYRDLKDLTIVPLVGGSDSLDNYLQINEIVRLFADKANGSHVYIYAPVNALSQKEKEIYFTTSQMKQIARYWDNLKVAIVGVGRVPSMPNITEKMINRATLKDLMERPDLPATDICGTHYNIYGEKIDSPYNLSLINISSERLREMDNVICLSGGVSKAFSVVSALSTGLVKTLICDEQTAKYVIEISEM